MNKRRYLSDQEKADLLNAFDRLPEGRTGARDKFKAKHRLTWTLMNSWKKTPGVKKLLEASPKAADSLAHVEAHADAPEIPRKVVGQKRQFSLQQKAWLLGAYDSLPFGSDARGILLRKYGIYFNNISTWRKELKQEGIRVPNLKLHVTMNGAAPDITVEPYSKPGPKVGSHQKNPRQPKREPEKRARFESVHDAIAYMEIRREIEDRILEELKQHAGKTRDE